MTDINTEFTRLAIRHGHAVSRGGSGELAWTRLADFFEANFAEINAANRELAEHIGLWTETGFKGHNHRAMKINRAA